MDELTQPKSYLRIQTGLPVTIIKVNKKEWKDKEKFVVTLEGVEGGLIDASFQLPMNDITKKQYAKLLKAAKVQDSKSLVGKKIGIQINKSEYNGKFYWNPSHFFPVEYLQEGDVSEGTDFQENFGDF